MSSPKFSDVFSGEFLGYVTKYSERIQRILDDYEVVIFMARKAVCFFQAMVLNGKLVVPSSCQVLSSRATDYNVLSKYAGMRIAVIDDVVVKGESLRKVVSKLTGYGISVNVLVVACNENKDIKNDIAHFRNCTISDTYVVLDQKDVYSFAGMITEYIEASMYPFNIDQPIYTVDIVHDKLREFLYQNHAIELTSGLQRYYNISSHVIYLSVKKSIATNSPLSFLMDSILKIRIFSNGERTTAFLFVIFPEITYERLDSIFSLINTDDVRNLINVENKRMVQENKMRIVGYFLADVLFNSFFKPRGIEFQKQEANDIFQFTGSTRDFFDDISKDFDLNNKETLKSISPIHIEFSHFNISNLLASSYQTISKIDSSTQKYIDAEGKAINNDIIVTRELLSRELFSHELHHDNDNAKYLASCVIDVFIDHGLIVPSIIHTENGMIVRAYKMGEYSKLTRSQIESFAAMLFQYQEMIQNSLFKTEFEKLCVLFFKTAIARGKFVQQEKYEDGCYSICYSLYGPRVSTSALSYRVSSDSAIITDFCPNDPNEERLALLQHGRYTLKAIGAKSLEKGFATGFAYQYSALKRVFDDAERTRRESKNKRTPWNMYVHTYIQYLTLRAIGNSKKNKYLSLCAELFQVVQLSDSFFDLDENDRFTSERVLSGINSGLWKYWCYSGDALTQTTLQVFEKDNSVGAMLLLDEEQPSDKKDEWDKAIDRVGRLLYKIAFFINEVLITQKRGQELRITDSILESDGKVATVNKKNLFTLGSYYNSDPDLVELRHRIENNIRNRANSPDFIKWCNTELLRLKDDAQFQLDVCDLILSNNNASVVFYTKYLIAHTKEGIFPEQFACIDATERELYLDGDFDNSKVKIFGLKEGENGYHILQKLYTSTERAEIRYFVLDLDNPGFLSVSDEQSRQCKCTLLAKKVGLIIENLKQKAIGSGLYVVTPNLSENLSKAKDITYNTSVNVNPTDSTSICKTLQECFADKHDKHVIYIDLRHYTNYMMGAVQEFTATRFEGDNRGEISIADNNSTIITF